MKAVNINNALISRWESSFCTQARPGQISDYKEQVLNYKKVGLSGEVGAFLHLTMRKSKPRLVGIGWVFLFWFGFLLK